jgi:hypothetical protein
MWDGMSNKTCPKCGSSRVVREIQRIRWEMAIGYYGGSSTKNGWVDAGWNCCLDCWAKWDGIVSDPGYEALAIFPAGVVRRDVGC